MPVIAADTRPRTVAARTAVKSIPPLENGDLLTRAEFERRYEAMPHIKKAELIEGRVHMPSPVRYKQHSNPQVAIVGWLFVYCAETSGVEAGDNGTVRLDLDNEPQPDGFLLIRSSLGGQARIDSDDYVSGAPELCAEVAASSASIDLNAKLEAYRRNGVKEYLVWRVIDREIDWFVLRRRRYVKMRADAGILKSSIFPGLWLDVDALLRGDMKRVLQVLQQGLADPAHAAFVERLRNAAGK